MRYSRSLGIAPETVRPLITLFWVEYALEKSDALDRLRPTGAVRDDTSELGVWSLAAFADNTCRTSLSVD